MKLEEISIKEKQIKGELSKYDQAEVSKHRKDVWDKCDNGKVDELDLSDELTDILYEEYRLTQQRIFLNAKMNSMQPEMQEYGKLDQREPESVSVQSGKPSGFLAGILGFFRKIVEFFKGGSSAKRTEKTSLGAGKSRNENVQAKKKNEKQEQSDYEYAKKLAQEEADYEYAKKFQQEWNQTTQKQKPQKKVSKETNLSMQKVPQHIQASGNAKDLQKYLDQHNELSPDAKQELNERIRVANKIENIQSDKKKVIQGQCSINGQPVSNMSLDQIRDSDTIMLENARQPEKQSTTMGCWSVSLQTQLAYRGVELTQEEIRRYRPELNYTKNSGNNIAELVRRLNNSLMNEIFDVADLVQSVLPDTAHHHMAIGNGEANRDRNKKFFKETVRKALMVHNSPVSVLKGVHYLTIVGMQGDTLFVKDPQNSGNATTTISIDSVFDAKNATGATGELAGECNQVMVDWLEDMKYTQDGKCLEIENEWAPYGMTRNQGRLKNTDEPENDGVSHIKGVEFQRFGVYDKYGNYNESVYEQIYVPERSYKLEKQLRNSGKQNVQAASKKVNTGINQAKQPGGIKK